MVQYVKENFRGINNNSGFTMVEVMVATGIFFIGFLAVAHMQMKSVNGNAAARIQTEATAMAVDRLERLTYLPYNHPDILEFINCKNQDLDAITHANISVIYDQDFIDAVEADAKIELKFRNKVYGTLDARKLWKVILENMLNTGEPGLLNISKAQEYSNSEWCAPVASTNPCAEEWLAVDDVCCLGSICVDRFVDPVRKMVNYKSLKTCVKSAVRFLDNVISLSRYPLHQIQYQASNIRRIGVGGMGFHSALLLMGKKYSEDYMLIPEIMKFITLSAYEESVELAKEKGPFPYFDKAKYLYGPMAGYTQKALPVELQNKIATHGIRNICVSTVPPTGTTGMIAETSTGIERFCQGIFR